MNDRHFELIFLSLLALSAVTVSSAQVTRDIQNLPETPPARSIEDLNYLGGDAAMPTFSDSVISADSSYRKALFNTGLAFRVISQVQYVQNVLDAPVRPHDQVYVGQRPFESAMAQTILVTDLRQLHLNSAQLYAGAVWNWVSWNPAGPKSLQMWDLYFYKGFGEKRMEMKAGYISLNLDFIGLFVGGSTATGAQGVYAVLPYEAGLSYFPLTTPAVTLRFRGPNHTYFKPGVQRSIDPNGGLTEVARNHTGFRFIPHGDKALLIGEGGYLRHASQDAREAWFRAGYMYNTTAYQNVATGRSDSGNYCTYVLMDYQLRRSSLDHPGRGLYAGGSFMTAPESLNPYARYYEARLYKEAPLRSRPADLLSVIASRTNYSRQYTDILVSTGKTVWHGGTTLTGSYSMRASPGNYASVGLTYVYGPAITPRVPNALKLTATWTSYF
jgi:porin